VPVTLKNLRYNPDLISESDIQYEYSVDGENYLQIFPEESGVEINSV
jgi:hypothetical protein